MFNIFPSVEEETELEERINPPHLQPTPQDLTSCLNELSSDFI